MHSIRRLILSLLGIFLLVTASSASAITLGQVDDFDSGDEANWGPSFVDVIPDGGPDGAGDGYLRYANGGGGSGGKMHVRNTEQWAGDYATAGVTGISFYAINLGETNLNVRVAIGNGTGGRPADDGTWYSSTTAVTLAPGSGWTLLTMDLSELTLTQVEGTESLSQLLLDVTHLRIVSSEEPANRGTNDLGVIGLDDITAVPEPSVGMLVAIGLIGLGMRGRARG
jgi:hypothetical protein